MGYTTKFTGRFLLNKPLTEDDYHFLLKFSETRRIPWRPTEFDHKGIEWSGDEKFYCYGEWLKYLLKNWLIPHGYTLTGSVKFQGEEPSDKGSLEITVDGTVTEHRTFFDEGQEFIESEDVEIEEEDEDETVIQTPPPASNDGMTVLKPRKIRLE